MLQFPSQIEKFEFGLKISHIATGETGGSTWNSNMLALDIPRGTPPEFKRDKIRGTIRLHFGGFKVAVIRFDIAHKGPDIRSNRKYLTDLAVPAARHPNVADVRRLSTVNIKHPLCLLYLGVRNENFFLTR